MFVGVRSMERVLRVIENVNEIQVNTKNTSVKLYLKEQRDEQNKLIGIDKGLRKVRHETSMKQLNTKARLIKTPFKFNTEEIQKIGWKKGTVQGKVFVQEKIKLFVQQKNVKVYKIPFRFESEKILKVNIAVPCKCTEILKGINYARNIYLPKKFKLGIKLVNEAVGYLKYQVECLKLAIEADKAYEAARKECLKEVQNLEEKVYTAEKELTEDCPAKKVAEIAEKVQEIEAEETKVFERLDKLNKDILLKLRCIKPKNVTHKNIQFTLNEFLAHSVAIEV
ncbi:MAG: hypothetical protein AAGU10_08385 [Methanosarcina mazei]